MARLNEFNFLLLQAQKKGLDLDEKMERAKEKIRQLEESSEHDYSTASTVTCVEEEQN